MTSTPTTPPTATLTARSPEDLLAAAAVVLGFWPADSVVMLTFDAVHRFHARIDLPATAEDREGAVAVAEALARPAAHHRAARVVLLVYSEDHAVVAAVWPQLRAAFAARRIRVLEALHVGSNRWRSLVTADPVVRVVGVAYDRGRLASHPFLAEAVLAGRVTRDTRADLAATLEPDPDAMAAVVALVERGGSEPVAVLVEGTWAETVVAGHLDGATRCSDDDAARLLRGMRALGVRDAAWSAITRERARAGVEFFTDLVRRSPPALRAAPAALVGWSAWQAGDGALAWCAVECCDDVHPGYSLADMLATALERAVPPTVWHEGIDWRDGLDRASSP